MVNIISGSSLPVNGGVVTQNIDDCKLNGKAISVYSPIDINVTDQQGNILGLAEDQSIINTIPNANFEILDDHKFMYLPTDEGQQYNISMKGTGEGLYTITIDDIQQNVIEKSEIFSNLLATKNITGTINLGAQDSIIIKRDSNSQPETLVPSLPEAIISFNPVTLDITFQATDQNVNTVIDHDDVITILDEAGNSTTLQLKQKDRKKRMEAEIKMLKYNGVTVDMSKNEMKYNWSLDKNKKLISLVQKIKSKKDFTIEAKFDGINTKIVGKDASGKISKTLKGLVILKVKTNKGDLSWSY